MTSGVLLGVSFPPFGLPYLAWVALVPLLVRWSADLPWRRIYVEATAAYALTFAVAFSWPLLHALPRAALASAVGVVALPFVLAVPFAASAPLRRAAGAGPGLLALAGFCLAVEQGLSHGALAMPWPLLGHTQATHAPFNQLAAVSGVTGLSAWVLALNVVATAGILGGTTRRRAIAAVAFAVLVAVSWSTGRHQATSLPPAERHLRVGLVQPALAPERWADVYDAARVDDLLALSDALLADTAGPPPAVILWPETALPVLDHAADRRALYERLRRWTSARGTALLTGAVVPAEQPGGFHNAAMLFVPGAPHRRYAKARLVPFAERVPGIDVLPGVRALAVPAGGVYGYVPGPAPDTLAVGGASILPMICFESLFGEDVRRAPGRVDVLAVLTQDGWWGETAGFAQHAAFNRLRAIEARRALVQVSVTGTSALLLPDGTVPFATGWMERTAAVVDVPLYTGESIYGRKGDWLGRIALVLSAVALGALLLLAYTRRPSGPVVPLLHDPPR